MTIRDHLRRLDDSAYRGGAAVHWALTIRDRRRGWLDAVFCHRLRELLTHSQFRFHLACPLFCVMPDHLHLMWLGISHASDQRRAMRHLRKRLNLILREKGFELQDQPYDNVLSPAEQQESAFRDTCEYIAENPERAGLVGANCCSEYRYTGCVIPGYPELDPFASDYWMRLDRCLSFLRRTGVAVREEDAAEQDGISGEIHYRSGIRQNSQKKRASP